MRSPVLALGLVVLATVPAFALLPPQYQRQAELAAIIDNAAVTEAFGMEGIYAVEYIDQDLYRVYGAGCTLDVSIVDAPTAHEAGFAGPREFTTELGEKVCPEE